MNKTDYSEKPMCNTEACEYLGLSKSTMYKLTQQGKIKFYRPNGKLTYFRRSDLISWAFSNEGGKK